MLKAFRRAFRSRRQPASPLAESGSLPTLDTLYQPERVASLFNRMSATYGWINLITSFGFSWWWRRQCVQAIPLRSDMQVYDLMSGMGEVWGALAQVLDASGSVLAVDFSAGMMQGARKHQTDFQHQTQLIQADLLDRSRSWQAADAVVSCFGLKTFSKSQQVQFAQQITHFLKPGGCFAMLEISVPDFAPLRLLYLFYLKQVIPLAGKLLLGNPDHYRLLGVYTEGFVNARHFYDCLAAEGFHLEYRRYFWGCASGVVGSKPLS